MKILKVWLYLTPAKSYPGYAAGHWQVKALEIIFAIYLQLIQLNEDRYVYQPDCYEAIEHLFRVSSGLDSMILGLIGQVKEAYQKAGT